MNEAFVKWYDEWSITAQCVHPAHSAEEAWKALELHVSKALGGIPESELWGDDGLIAATMRVCAAYDNLIEDCKLVRAIACGEEQVADNDTDGLAYIYDLLKDPCEPPKQ